MTMLFVLELLINKFDIIHKGYRKIFFSKFLKQLLLNTHNFFVFIKRDL